MRELRWAASLLTLTLVVACTPGTSPSPAETPSAATSPTPTASASPGPAAPVQQFAPLPGTDTGANDWVNSLAAAGNRVVAVGGYVGWRGLPTFRYSEDGGRSWQLGSLSSRAAGQTPVTTDERPELVVAPGRTKQWLALSSGDPAVAWTSTDARTWDRHVIAAGQIRSADGVAQLTTTPTGYLAVGSRNLGATSRPMAWTSSDGLTWKARRVPGIGSVSGVAVRGRTAVAVGSNDDGDDNRTWRSTDGGATWRRGGIPPRVSGDGDFSRSLSGVTVRGNRFVAIGHAWTDEYEPTLYTSRDGRSWRAEAALARSLDLSGNDYGGELVGAGEVAVTEKKGTFDVDQLWYRDGSRYRLARTPLTGENVSAIWSVEQVVKTSRGWLASVSEFPNGRTRGHLWFSANGRTYDEIDFPAAEPKVATVFPNSLVLSDGQPVVVGSSRGRPAWWRATGKTPYRANTLADQFGLSAYGVVASSRAVLIWGSVLGGNSTVGTVWAGTAAGPFTRTRSGTFGKVEDYGYSEIHQIRRIDGEWIAVGERSRNGSANRSALVSTSIDGRRWRDATAAKTYISKDKAPGGYAVTDLAGSDDHVRSANDVVGGVAGPIVVGSSAERGEPQATVWRAVRRDGRQRWQLERLPVRGYEESDMVWAQAGSRAIVILGSVRKKGASRSLPYVWRSDDGGRTFSGQLLPLTGLKADETGVNLLLRTSGSFVLIGATGQDITQPLAWRSPDGKAWTRFALDIPAASAANDAFPVDVATDGTDLVHLVRATNQAGSGVQLVRQRVG